MPPTPAREIVRIAQRSLFGGSLGVTWAQKRRLYDGSFADVELRAGTTVSLQLDPGHVFLTAAPPISVQALGPDFGIEQLGYDFRTARFAIRTTTGLARAIVDALVSRYIDREVKPLLPGRVRAGNYSLADDPDPMKTWSELAGSLRMQRGSGSGPSSLDPVALLREARDPALWLDLELRDEVSTEFALDPGSAPLRLRLPKGAKLSVDLRARGTLAQPAALQLDPVKITAAPNTRGVILESTGTSIVDAFTALDIRGVTLTRGTPPAGPTLDFDVQLRIESLANALLGLARVAELVGSPTPSPQDPPEVRFEPLRRQVRTLLAREAAPLFRSLVAGADGAIPGVSLLKLLGFA